MHSRIVELTLEPLDREDWAHEDCFCDDEKVNYVSELDDEERSESIADLQDGEDPFFSGLFIPGDNDTIIFKGKDALNKIQKEWANSIKEEVDNLVESGNFDTYGVTHAINHVLDSDYLFCLPDWTGCCAVWSRELTNWLNTLEDGTVLHIGAVIKYHYQPKMGAFIAPYR